MDERFIASSLMDIAISNSTTLSLSEPEIVNNNGMIICEHLAKWILYNGHSPITTEDAKSLADRLNPQWINNIESFVTKGSNVLKESKSILLSELNQSPKLSISNPQLQLVGDFHGSSMSTFKLNSDNCKTFYIKSARHKTTTLLYNQFIQCLGLTIPQVETINFGKKSQYMMQPSYEEFDINLVDDYSLGEFTILCYILGSVDVLKENVGLLDKKPVLFDSECIFSSPGFIHDDFSLVCKSLLSLQRTGIFGNIGQDKNSGLIKDFHKSYSSNKDFIRGVICAAKKVIKKKNDLEIIIKSNTRNLFTRKIFRDTSFYQKMIRDMWHPKVMSGELTQDSILNRIRDIDSKNPFNKLIRSEIESLKIGAIPVFCCANGKLFDGCIEKEIKISLCQPVTLFKALTETLTSNSIDKLLSWIDLWKNTQIMIKDSSSIKPLIEFYTSEISNRLFISNGNTFFIDNAFSDELLQGLKLSGPGILNGLGGILLTCLEYGLSKSNEVLFEKIIDAVIDSILEINEEDGNGLFIGPISGFLALCITADNCTKYRNKIYHSSTKILDKIAEKVSLFEHHDLTHGVIGAMISLHAISQMSWIKNKFEIAKLLEVCEGNSRYSIQELYQSEYLGVAHGRLAILFLTKILALSNHEIKSTYPGLNTDLLILKNNGLWKWCTGLGGLPAAELKDYTTADYPGFDEVKLINCEVSIRDFLPCHGIYSYYFQYFEEFEKIKVIERLFKPNPPTLSFAYGTGWSGLVSILSGEKSWLTRACDFVV